MNSLPGALSYMYVSDWLILERRFLRSRFLQVINTFHCFAIVFLWNKWRGSFFENKIASQHPKMLDAKFGLNKPIGFREYEVLKRRQFILTILITSPFLKVNRLEHSLSMNAYTNWNLSGNWLSYFFKCLCLVMCYYCISICVMVCSFVTKKYFILPSFIMTCISAN